MSSSSGDAKVSEDIKYVTCHLDPETLFEFYARKKEDIISFLMISV